MGVSATATQTSATAVGSSANATAAGAIGVGQNADAIAAGIAIGHNSDATQTGAVALGGDGSDVGTGGAQATGIDADGDRRDTRATTNAVAVGSAHRSSTVTVQRRSGQQLLPVAPDHRHRRQVRTPTCFKGIAIGNNSVAASQGW